MRGGEGTNRSRVDGEAGRFDGIVVVRERIRSLGLILGLVLGALLLVATLLVPR